MIAAPPGTPETGQIAAAFLAAAGLPLLLALLLLRPAGRRLLPRLLPLAPLPALAAAWRLPDGATEIGWLLMGLEVGLDGPGRPVLAAMALVWLATGLQVSLSRRRAGRAKEAAGDRGAEAGDGIAEARFAGFFLICQAGTLGAAMALGRPAFYACFAMATLASYGLIVTGPGLAARRAGRLYLALALAGELTVLAAFMARSLGAESATVTLLLYLGFGAKLGIVPLHVALPPAYAAAPPVGAAPLAGPVLTVAALGWLRFVPLETGGAGATAHLGTAILSLGFLAAFYGALVGILQRRPAALLAYSSISQMGILMAALGLALATGAETAGLAAGAAVLVAHHALAKSALFLGLGARRDGPGGALVLPALVLLALSLAGLTATGGALGKLWVETLALDMAGPAAGLFATLLPLTSVATGLYMARFLWLARRAPATARGPGGPAAALALAAVALPWAMAWSGHPHPLELAFAPKHVWQTLWPVALAAGIAAAAAAVHRQADRMRPAVPPGDIGARLLRVRPGAQLARPAALVDRLGTRGRRLPDIAAADRRLQPLAVYGSVYLALLLVLMLMAEVL